MKTSIAQIISINCLYKMYIPPVPDFNVPESVKCLILNIMWNYIGGKVLDRFSNKLRCFSMTNF